MQKQGVQHSIRLARDADGWVHTRRGFLSQKSYEALRLAHPEHAFPEHAALPLLSELEEKDQRL